MHVGAKDGAGKNTRAMLFCRPQNRTPKKRHCVSMQCAPRHMPVSFVSLKENAKYGCLLGLDAEVKLLTDAVGLCTECELGFKHAVVDIREEALVASPTP